MRVFLRRSIHAIGVAALLAGAAFAQPQQPPPQGAAPPPGTPPGFFIAPPRPAPAQAPAQAAPAAPGAPAQPAPPPAGAPTVFGGLSLNNVSLTEVIDLLPRQLKINYILDPRVKGGVVLNTYGEIKNIDTRSLLDTILRINGAGMVQQGDIYRIVPLAEISHLPLPPETKPEAKSIPEDDQTMFDLIFLKYVMADELSKVLQPFIGEGATIGTYAPANLLLVLDSRRNMRRLMDLIAMFDSDQLANQRVHVFETKNGRPSDISKELDNIEKSISLSDKTRRSNSCRLTASTSSSRWRRIRARSPKSPNGSKQLIFPPRLPPATLRTMSIGSAMATPNPSDAPFRRSTGSSTAMVRRDMEEAAGRSPRAWRRMAASAEGVRSAD